MKSQQSTNAFIKETFMDLKTQLKTVAKNHQPSIQNLETKFDRLADKQSGRPSGSLPSNTQPNPKNGQQSKNLINHRQSRTHLIWRLKKGVKALFKERYKDCKNNFKTMFFALHDVYNVPKLTRNKFKRKVFESFSDHVTSDKHMNRFRTNKVNRPKQLYSLNHGTKSYAL
ncbi:hypothetical protein Tco_1359658 [Tanacetum coccineum]